MLLPVQSFPAELLLLALVIGLALLALRAVRRRRAFAPAAAVPASDLPRLQTQQRVAATIRRVFRDPAQGVWLAVAEIGTQRVTFCATDYEQAAERYQALAGQRPGRAATGGAAAAAADMRTDIALFGLATLASGGVEAMQDQIKDLDKVEITPDLVRLIPAGEFANDHVVIGKVHSHREDAWEDMPLTVYRTEVVRRPDLTLVLDLAVAREGAASPEFPERSMVHGSARLFGYLAGAAS